MVKTMMYSLFCYGYAGVVERSNTTDCKSVGFRLRRFESYPQYQLKTLFGWTVSLIGRRTLITSQHAEGDELVLAGLRE